MKATGIVRNVDSVGRIVLPAEMREIFGLKENGGLVEFFVEDDRIILKKYEPCCIFCKEADDVISFMGKNVCKKCAEKIGAEIK